MGKGISPMTFLKVTAISSEATEGIKSWWRSINSSPHITDGAIMVYYSGVATKSCGAR